MNKAIVNQEIGIAYEALSKCGIATKDGEIVRSFRGQISTFGAAVTMGSLKAAIAFFSKDEKTKVERSKLIEAIFEVIKQHYGVNGETLTLYDYVVKSDNEDECKEKIMNATIAIKLAMNLYVLTDEKV